MEFNVLVLKCLDGLFLVEGLKMESGVIDLDIMYNGVVETVVEVTAQSGIFAGLAHLSFGDH